jgi:hypothetical protein
VIAAIFAFFFGLAMFTGEVPGQRKRRTVRREERPQMYWMNVGCMLAVALVAGAIGVFGWLGAKG